MTSSVDPASRPAESDQVEIEPITGHSLKDLVFSLEAGTPRLNQIVNTLLTSNPVGFFQTVAELVSQQESGTPPRFLGRILATNPAALVCLCDPQAFSLQDAAMMARWLGQFDSALDAKIVHHVLSLDKPSQPVLSRMLDLMAEISDGARLRLQLVPLLRHPEKRVRSKASLIIGRSRKDIGWIEPAMTDTDHRVRANSVESMWGQKHHHAANLFRLMAADAHHRVVANALVGLHLAGHPKEAAEKLLELSRRPHIMCRAAACWAMSRIGDPVYLPHLKDMAKDTDSAVRGAAMTALVRLNRASQG